MFRLIAVLFLVSALLTPWATPVAYASASQADLTPTPWGDAEPVFRYSPADGSRHALWQHGDSIMHSSESNGGWSDPAVAVITGSDFAAAFAPDGTLHVVFTNYFMGNWEVYHTLLSPEYGSVWVLPRPVSRTVGDSLEPQLAVAPDGILYAVWQDNTAGYWSTFWGDWSGGFWSSEQIPSARGFLPNLFVTSDDTLLVGFVDFIQEGAIRGVFLTERLNGVWEIPTLVATSEGSISNLVLAASPLAGYQVRLSWNEANGGVRFVDLVRDVHPNKANIRSYLPCIVG